MIHKKSCNGDCERCESCHTGTGPIRPGETYGNRRDGYWYVRNGDARVGYTENGSDMTHIRRFTNFLSERYTTAQSLIFEALRQYGDVLDGPRYAVLQFLRDLKGRYGYDGGFHRITDEDIRLMAEAICEKGDITY